MWACMATKTQSSEIPFSMRLKCMWVNETVFVYHIKGKFSAMVEATKTQSKFKSNFMISL